MLLNSSVLFRSGWAGFVALTGLLVGCQAQPPAPLPSPSLEASTPSPSAKSVPFSPGTQSPPQTPTQSTGTPSPVPGSPETEATRTVEKCKVSMARVNDPNPPLNVRSSPSTESPNNIVGQLKNGAFVSVVEEQPDWFRISEPAGWIARARTESNCNLKVERIQFGQGQTSMKIADRFIGTGSHEYRLNLAKGQRITLNSSAGLLPSIVTPDQKYLNAQEKSLSWTVELPTTGDYTLMMESNYKGYAYSFTVKVQ